MFKDRLSVKDLAQKLEIYLINGSAHIVKDMNKYHIILPRKCYDIDKDNIFKDINNELILGNTFMSKYSVIQQRLKFINELLEGELAKLNNQPNNLLKYKNDISAVQDNLRNYNQAFLAHNEKVYDDLKVFQRNIDHLFKMSDVNRAMEQNDKTKENIKEKLLSLKNSEIIDKHDDVIRCAILLPDNYIASASDDKTIKIWDVNNKHVYKVPKVTRSCQFSCFTIRR
jgi:WD40 repeat protein